MFDPPHPGRILREYLGNVPVDDLARRLGVTRAALSQVLSGRAGISPDMALRLSKALGTSSDLWWGMQSDYDLWQASKRTKKRITATKRPQRPMPKCRDSRDQRG